MTNGVELIAEQYIPEINSQAKLLRHRVTRARLLSICNTDKNKVFGITFCTPPASFKGIAHILDAYQLPDAKDFTSLTRASPAIPTRRAGNTATRC